MIFVSCKDNREEPGESYTRLFVKDTGDAGCYADLLRDVFLRDEL